MSSAPANPDPPTTPAERARRSAVLPVFTVTIFVSAFLLFSIQPMFTKMVLPKLGGSPGVWSVAMLFFQSVLLAGYAYAHLLASRLGVRRAAVVHLVLMAVVLATALPFGLSERLGRPPVDAEAWWLIGVFAASVGLPFFAVSANGPLLQAWFARTGHPHANDPYFLYGASNLGSLLALLSYPLLVEPLTLLGQQSLLWTWGFAVLLALIGVCASVVSLGRLGQVDPPVPDAPVEYITASRRLGWTALAFVPSALLVAVTAHISSDIASAPFMWVVPLSVFLLTFIITFQRQPVISHSLMLTLQPFVLALPIVSVMSHTNLGWTQTIALHLAAFFCTAMVCHGELVQRRPSPAHLTEFYLWVSFGGVLGGLFAGLLSPLVFSWVAEYPLLLLASLLCRPGLIREARDRLKQREALAIGGLAAVIVAPGLLFGVSLPSTFIYRITLLAIAILLVMQGRRPLRLAVLGASALLFTGVYADSIKGTEWVRSFFGVHKVFESADGEFRVLTHGTTVHGAMRIRGKDGQEVSGRPVPATYFSPNGPIAQAINVVREGKGGFRTVSIIGVGSGSLSCYRKDGEAWTFYDIDADVVRIARDPTKFRFISTCAPDATFILGDARVMIADAPDRSMDILVVDAFTSDAIPVHLLTREAIALYTSKLREDGVLVVHISNRVMELASVVTANAAEQGWSTWLRRSQAAPVGVGYDESAAIVAVVAHDEADIGALATLDGWVKQERNPDVAAWTDDYANIVGAIWREMRRVPGG